MGFDLSLNRCRWVVVIKYKEDYYDHKCNSNKVSETVDDLICLKIDHMHEALGNYRPMDPRLKLESNNKLLNLLTRKQN